MSSRKKYTGIIILCAIAIAVLIFFVPSYGWQLRAALSPQDVMQMNDASLAAQNEALEAQVAKLQDIQAQLPQVPADDILAMVYSRYPLNFKNQFLVNVGSDEGVIVGKAVIFQGVFIGSIESVFPESALVQTVFDPGFKTPVRIGSNGYDGLLIGGADPKVTSISKNSALAIGDVALTAAPGIPYGLPIANVSATGTSPDNLFQEASLNFAYDINSVDAVLVEK